MRQWGMLKRAIGLILTPLLLAACANCASTPPPPEFMEPKDPPITMEPTEPGLLTFTSTTTGSELTVLHHWLPADFPLVVMVTPDAERWAHQIDMAAQWWNIKLGFEVFRTMGVMDLPPEKWEHMTRIVAVIPFDRPMPWDPDYGQTEGRSETGSMINPFTGHLIRSVVAMTQKEDLVSDDHSAARIARHELGHVLGLDHDTEDRDSLMFDYVLHTEYDLTQYDRMLLRYLYDPDNQ